MGPALRHRRRRRGRLGGATYVQGLALLALALGAIGVVLLLRRVIHAKYRCAADVVAQRGDGVDCGGASQRFADDGPTPPLARVGDPPAVGSRAPLSAVAAEGTAPAAPRPEAVRSTRTAEHDEIVRRVLQRSERATPGDVAFVRRELRELPIEALRTIERVGVRVVATHDRVTEVFPHLKGQSIGFGGRTYDDPVVSGHYSPAARIIVIPVAPARADPEGDSVAHEVGHALDHSAADDDGMWASDHDEEFKRARQLDMGKLPAYQRAPEVGVAETYAQSFADYLSGRNRWPHLHAYWDCAIARRCKPDGKPLDPGNRAWNEVYQRRLDEQMRPLRTLKRAGQLVWEILRQATW
jgi:hypothetical protein